MTTSSFSAPASLSEPGQQKEQPPVVLLEAVGLQSQPAFVAAGVLTRALHSEAASDRRPSPASHLRLSSGLCMIESASQSLCCR